MRRFNNQAMFCPRCGASLSAPGCARCGGPASPATSVYLPPPKRSGRLAIMLLIVAAAAMLFGALCAVGMYAWTKAGPG
jgi:hypothetical protein